MVGLNFRQVVTGHDTNGRAVFRKVVTSEPRLPGYEARVFWATSSFPPSDIETSFDNGAPGERGTRALFLVGEIPGESGLPYMHRTETPNVAVMLTGRRALRPDSGEVVKSLGPGDVVVQRATMRSRVARRREPMPANSPSAGA